MDGCYIKEISVAKSFETYFHFPVAFNVRNILLMLNVVHSCSFVVLFQWSAVFWVQMELDICCSTEVGLVFTARNRIAIASIHMLQPT